MSRTTAEPKEATISVRMPSDLKDALCELAAAEAKPVGELLRDLVRERVKQVEREKFIAEARRQSLVLAEAAWDPNSDEAQILRELDAHFDEFERELTAREEAAEARAKLKKSSR